MAEFIFVANCYIIDTVLNSYCTGYLGIYLVNAAVHAIQQ